MRCCISESGGRSSGSDSSSCSSSGSSSGSSSSSRNASRSSSSGITNNRRSMEILLVIAVEIDHVNKIFMITFGNI